MLTPNFDREENYSGFVVAGVDEAGMGCFSGPVVAAAVILPKDFCILGINDSKKLTAKKREELYDIIVENCDVGLGVVDNDDIDKVNILNASKKAMIIAIYTLPRRPDIILIDGPRLLWIDIPHEGIIDGDQKSMSIAAASIVAKVERDYMMMELHNEFPQYNWKQNKGYGTKEHRDAIKKYGITKYHRKSYRGVA